jgi:hypothetical protein
MKYIYKKILTEGLEVEDSMYKETVYKSHVVQKIDRRISNVYRLECTHTVHVSGSKINVKGEVGCFKCYDYKHNTVYGINKANAPFLASQI